MFIVYDPILKRPGCINLQADMGGNVPDFSFKFPSETWLLTPTTNMACLPITEKQLAVLEKIARTS